jgi:transcription elongation GreA/GreB family factor
LVFTNQGIYFILIGLGKISVGGNNYYAISLASPIGMLFSKKKVGDEIDFQHQRLRINEIC